MKWIFVIVLAIAGVFRASGQQITVSRLSPALQQYIAASAIRNSPDSINLIILWKENGGPLPLSWRFLQQYGKGIKLVRIPAHPLAQLSYDPRIEFAGLATKPKEELTTGSLDISLNKLNTAHAFFPQIRGAGQRISFKEQRFDTSDIDYRNRIIYTGVEAALTSSHASLMATIAAGAGNTSEEALGAAPGALVGSSSFENLLPDPDSLMQGQNTYIQNHSYGTVVENYYGLEAVAFDAQVFAVPQLLHVFSAGNAGLTAGAGTYKDVAARANLTGNFKYAKNVLTIGALDSFAQVAPQSSKGPAFDGRVKPELMAFGEDGSSGAAALVSGTAALLQQAYYGQTGTLPPAALLKAVLIGSAFDLGAAGVDYESGWGAVDALAALNLINHKNYAWVKLAAGTQKIIPVQVPAGIKRLVVTVSWTDRPAAANASKALLNDIDLVVRHAANGQAWLPWVLNPHRDSLSQPAKRSLDTLNNTEQVWIDDPAPGLYHFIIKGTHLTAPEQEAALAWQMDTAGSFLFTYPTANDRLESGRSQLLRWQTSMKGSGTLQVAYNDGIWQNVASVADLSKNYVYWPAPDTNAVLRLRMLLPGNAIKESERFIISRLLGLDVGFRCADSVMLTWGGKQDRRFEVQVLSGNAMQPLLATADSFAIVRTPAGAVPIYSVSPVVNGVPGRRSFSLNTDASGVGCYFKSFYVQGQDAQSAVLRIELGTTYHLSAVSTLR